MAIRRTRWLLVLGLAAWAAAGCQQRKIEVVVQDTDRTGDYGRHALRASVQKFRSAPRSPEAYRAMAVEIDRLRPAFNQDAADEAERNLVFLALGPMAAQLDKPFEEQMNTLALTVWPTALHVAPKKGEAPRAYLERACAGPVAAECKYVVPEYWSLVLTARVWRRLKNRAREAYGQCRPCKQDPTYAALLEEYDQYESRLTRLASDEKGRVERDAWPEAGDNAAEWSGAPVLDLVPEPPASWASRSMALARAGARQPPRQRARPSPRRAPQAAHRGPPPAPSCTPPARPATAPSPCRRAGASTPTRCASTAWPSAAATPSTSATSTPSSTWSAPSTTRRAAAARPACRPGSGASTAERQPITIGGQGHRQAVEGGGRVEDRAPRRSRCSSPCRARLMMRSHLPWRVAVSSYSLSGNSEL